MEQIVNIDDRRNLNHLNHVTEILENLNIDGKCIAFKKYKHFACYDIQLIPGAKVSKLERATREIALALKSTTTPIVKLIPEKGIVRLSVTYGKANTVYLQELFNKFRFNKSKIMPLILGEDEEGKPVWFDLSKNPHILIGGSTGSGKSVLLHNIIANCFNHIKTRFRQVELYLADPKRVEFIDYAENKYVTNISYDYESILATLQTLNMKMEARYEIMSKMGIKSIEHKPDLFSQVVLVVDEVGDLILQDNSQSKEKRGQLQKLIVSLTQKSRAAGIYIVMATQRPERTVITGRIKTNFQTRIACRVTSRTDSMVILDQTGAENLCGRGDAIMKNSEVDSKRFQVAYIES